VAMTFDLLLWKNNIS